MINQLLNIILPVFFVVGIGYLYGRWRETDLSAINKINIELFTPVLVLSVFATQQVDLFSYGPFIIAAFALSIIPGLLLWPMARFAPVDRRAWLLCMMFRNTGNMGLPLALFTFGEALMPAAVILFVASTLLHFSLGLSIVRGRINLQEVFWHPTILAAVAGIGISLSALSIPLPLQRGLELAGDVAIPLMLFSLGVRMVTIDFRDWQLGVQASLVGPVSGLIAAAILILLLNIEGQLAQLIILYSALPPAVLNYLIAERYKLAPQKVASIVLISNASSILVIPVVLGFML